MPLLSLLQWLTDTVFAKTDDDVLTAREVDVLTASLAVFHTVLTAETL